MPDWDTCTACTLENHNPTTSRARTVSRAGWAHGHPCHHPLQRGGDTLLAGLLAALGPLASGSDDAARLGETCAEAARLWAEAGATLG